MDMAWHEEGDEGGSASWTLVLQVIGLEIRRFFIIQLVATAGAKQVLEFNVL